MNKMYKSKHSYLQKLTREVKMKSVNVDTNLDGTSPPSVFIGNWNYPKVYAGPMMSQEHGDTFIMDSPESWIKENKNQEDIIKYRLDLVRGKQLIDIKDLSNPFVEKLQEISMAKKSVDSEVTFNKKPKGLSFNSEAMPHGPSAVIEKFDIDNVKWDNKLEKTFYDGDLTATDAVMELHNSNTPFSSMQKAFSVGAIGREKNRRLVPTRWSITACDSTIAENLLKDVRQFDILDTHRVYEFSSFNNKYEIILMPTEWQYEWMEAFIKILGKEEIIFSDYERNTKKKEYSRVGGCFYTCKMAVLDALHKEKKQAGAVVLREAYENYIPLGVFNVRENVKHALKGDYEEFEDLKSAVKHVSTKLKMDISKYVKQSDLLKDLLKSKQTSLDAFFKFPNEEK